MQIIDSFLFHSEYDLLELRLEIMSDYVDKFVVVESDYTFTQKWKGYNLEKYMSRYDKWKDKIVYVKAEFNPDGITETICRCDQSTARARAACRRIHPATTVRLDKTNIARENAFKNEFWSRDQFKLGWDQIDLEDGDILIVSDCDEIIRPEALQFMRDTNYDYYALMSPIFNFKFNYMNIVNDYAVWPVAYRYYSNINYSPSSMRRTDIEHNRFRDRFSEVVKKGPSNGSVLLHHAAWHFSSLGNNETIRNKLMSYSHTEFNIPELLDSIDVEACINDSKNHINQNTGCWKKVKLDDYFPKYILKNKEKYKQFILEDDDCESVLEHFKNGVLEKVS